MRLGDVLPANKISGWGMKEFHEPEDLAWLFEVHIKPEDVQQVNRLMVNVILSGGKNVTAAIITGNEDCPEQIWVTTERAPMYDSDFRLVGGYVLDAKVVE